MTDKEKALRDKYFDYVMGISMIVMTFLISLKDNLYLINAIAKYRSMKDGGDIFDIMETSRKKRNLARNLFALYYFLSLFLVFVLVKYTNEYFASIPIVLFGLVFIKAIYTFSKWSASFMEDVEVIEKEQSAKTKQGL